METIGYLGPEGSYSYLAARMLGRGAELFAYGSFPLVMRAVVSGECGAAVFPIENSLNGSVTQVMDLLQYTQGVCAVEECFVEIDHRLATKKGAPLSGIKRIYSHQQALAQCGKYLFENFPQAELIATPSTAASLKMLKSAADACIVGAHINRESLALSKENIADEKNNFTRFLYVMRGNAEDILHSHRVYFSAECEHKPGALLGRLSVIKDGGLNMTEIQSRPVKNKAGEYRFFVEVDGDIGDAGVKKVLSAVKDAANSYKLLGAY